jgi:hypothetical protein
MRTRRLLLEGPSFTYWVVRRLFELLILCGRSERAKELEILVLRHELQVVGPKNSNQCESSVCRASLLSELTRILSR